MNLQDAIYTKKVMSDHNLSFTFSSPRVEDINVGNTINYKGQNLIIRKEPQVQKLSSNKYNYNVIFEGSLYQLGDMPFMHNGDITFSYFGNAEQYALLLAECMRVINPLWSIGDIAITEEKHISFDNVTCLEAIQQIADDFGIEWDINGYQINMPIVVGRDTGLTFEYGKGKGLYNITRSPVQNEGIFTRVLAYGSTKNLPEEYNGTRLKLNTPIDNNIDKYGLKVTTYINDNIYPHRDGVVSEVSADGLTFTDIDIDFDVNNYLLEGLVATVVFKSGELTGYEFEVVKYNDATKQFRIKQKVDGEDYILPNSTFEINVGDKYTIVNIRMPERYVEAALIELKQAAEVYLSEVSIPQVTYTCDIDVLHMKREGIIINAGDYVTIKDNDLGIDKKIRVQSISYPALYPNVLTTGMNFTIEIGDYITYSLITNIKKEIEEQKTSLGNVSKEAEEINRNAVMNLREFRSMVFDPDGNITEPFIQAIALEVGAESQYFDLNGVFINTNVGGNPNVIEITGGSLIHYAYSIDLGSTWLIEGVVKSDLVSTMPYYISAKCSKAALSGTWYISTTPMSVDAETGFYHFNLGTISSVINGQRMSNITKGYTRISGGQLETDSIIAKRIQTATSGARTTINVLPSDPNDPTLNTDYYVVNAIRQYSESGRISVYDGIVRNLVISVGGSPRTINGQARIVFKDEVGSPILYVVDSFTQNGMQYPTTAPVAYYEVLGQSLLSTTLGEFATDEDLTNLLFMMVGGNLRPRGMWCGYYEWATYILSLGISTEPPWVWQRVIQGQETIFVTENNGSTPITRGWYYRLGDYMNGNATYADDRQIIFNLNIQLQYINSQGSIQVIKDLVINNIRWDQGSSTNPICTSTTPQTQIQY